MPIHIWEFLTALYKRSKWFAVLSAASTLSLPFPFLGTHARWTIAVVALFAFVAANFRLYMDQQPEIERLSARGKGETPKSDLQLTAGAPRFTVSDATDGSVTVWAGLLFGMYKCGADHDDQFHRSSYSGYSYSRRA